MDKRTSGLVLIGFSLLTFVIAIGFDQLSNSIQRSAAYVKGGASVSYGGMSVPIISIILVVITIFIGLYIMKRN
ncbi:hypothetical protein [Virgibacillus siamensis]|uniref:hypothetical protein n=1 Tax=Virgibacillus siamensis TaxID=480071 RepID=UPI00098745B7|nr:hypothetical protein [Virgibacillus siamensis]